MRGDAIARTLCHCASCRRASGGTNVAWAVFANDAYDLLSGAIRTYRSSPGIHWGSCAECGSLVVNRRDSRPEHTHITTATLDDPDAFPPTVEIWTEARIGWDRLDPSLPHRPRSTLNENSA